MSMMPCPLRLPLDRVDEAHRCATGYPVDDLLEAIPISRTFLSLPFQTEFEFWAHRHVTVYGEHTHIHCYFFINSFHQGFRVEFEVDLSFVRERRRLANLNPGSITTRPTLRVRPIPIGGQTFVRKRIPVFQIL